MNEVLKTIDDQMLKWVAELDELHKKKRKMNRAIHELEQTVDAARKVAEFMKTSKTEELLVYLELKAFRNKLD